MKKIVEINDDLGSSRTITKEQFIKGFLKFCELAKHEPTPEDMKRLNKIIKERYDKDVNR